MTTVKLDGIKEVAVCFENVEVVTISPDDIRRFEISLLENTEPETIQDHKNNERVHFSDGILVLKKSANVYFDCMHEGYLFDRIRSHDDITGIDFQFEDGTSREYVPEWYGDLDFGCDNLGQCSEITGGGDLYLYFRNIGDVELEDWQYLQGTRCIKRLWLAKKHKGYENRQEQPKSIEAYMIREGARDVSDDADNKVKVPLAERTPDFIMTPYVSYFARDYHYRYVAWNGNLTIMIKTAKQWNNEYSDYACMTTKANFIHKGLHCRIDILIANNDWMELVETSQYPKVQDEDLQNLAYKYYILNALGYNVRAVSVLHKKPDYNPVDGQVTADGRTYSLDNLAEGFAANLQAKEKYMLEDCTEKVMKMQASVKTNLENFLNALKESFAPEVEIGSQCHEPWKCGYCKYCSSPFYVPFSAHET
jgi:hypothetical protein